MGHYKSNVRDLEFNLFEVFAGDTILGQGPFADIDRDTARSILEEVDRLAREGTRFTRAFVTAPVLPRPPRRCARYSVSGERRSFALLGSANGEPSAQDALRECILDAYNRVEIHE